MTKYAGPIEDAPAGTWVKAAGIKGSWHLRDEYSKDGCRWAYGGDTGGQAFKPLPAGTQVKETKALAAPRDGRGRTNK